MAVVVMRASVVCDLLHIRIAFVHVELRTAAHVREALGIAVVVPTAARKPHWHVHKIEVQVAPAGGAVQVHVNREGLARPLDLVEIVRVAVVRGWALHEVEAPGWSVLHRLPAVDDVGTRKEVLVPLAVLVDEQTSLLAGAKIPTRATHVRLAVRDEALHRRRVWRAGALIKTNEANFGGGDLTKLCRAAAPRCYTDGTETDDDETTCYEEGRPADATPLALLVHRRWEQRLLVRVERLQL
mmetsp:Transcript_27341/g.72612  ORF Transcript_27341/g.72612 Transcript_27341/m.72612 type:complete len:241 (-) Transcript_27341:108-830(-)